MKYEHRFQVGTPQEAVLAFHRSRSSLGAITPPPLMVSGVRAPSLLSEGDKMAFDLLFGPVRLRWIARIEEVSRAGFTDRQINGPFLRWTHRHSFVPLDATNTAVVDRVEASLRLHPLWGPVGLSMWLGMPLLFAYRAWKTKRLLERRG